jgi:ribosomal protein S18 acetylase RimI-like enzyme
MNLLFRKYCPQDFESICEIFSLSKKVEMSYSGIGIEIISLEKDEKLKSDFDNSQIIVAVLGEEILGFAGNNNDYISFMFVHPDYFGKGIGKALIMEVLINSQHVHLAVLKENIPAINLYKSFGFKIEKEFEGVYNGIKCKALKMVKL